MTSDDLAGQDLAPVEDASKADEVATNPRLDGQGEPDPGTSEAEGETPETTDGSADDKEDDQPKRKPNKVSARQRIDELTAKWRTEQQRAEQAAKEAEYYKQQLQNPQQVDPDDWDAQQKNQVRQALNEDRMSDAARRAQAALIERHNARADAFAAKLDDVRDVIPDIDQQFAKTPVTEVAADILAESEVGGELAIWLVKNPAEAHRIAALSPTQQAYALGVQEARIKAAPQARKVSQAPPPPSKIQAKSAPGKKSPSEMSDAEYSAWYQQRKAKRK